MSEKIKLLEQIASSPVLSKQVRKAVRAELQSTIAFENLWQKTISEVLHLSNA
jgi:hypothetical protein